MRAIFCRQRYVLREFCGKNFRRRENPGAAADFPNLTYKELRNWRRRGKNANRVWRSCGYFPALHIRLRADSSRAFLNTATPAIFPLKKFPIPPFSMTAPTVKSEPLSPIPCG